MTVNRKLAEHVGGRTRDVDANVERTWTAADFTVIQGPSGGKYQRPVNMRMSKWAGAEGVAAMRRGSVATT